MGEIPQRCQQVSNLASLAAPLQCLTYPLSTDAVLSQMQHLRTPSMLSHPLTSALANCNSMFLLAKSITGESQPQGCLRVLSRKKGQVYASNGGSLQM